MNTDLQNLTPKIENGGTTPQGRLSASEWNILLEAVKLLDLSGGGGVADSVAWGNITGKPSWIGNTKPSYSYSEIVGTPDLSEYAVKATTLAGYGITNAYTKIEVDNIFANTPNFTNGLKIGGAPVTYDAATQSFFFDGNIILSGGVAMRAALYSLSNSVFL